MASIVQNKRESQPESQLGSRPESQPESPLSLEKRVLHMLAKAPMGKREISEALGQKSVSGQLNKVIRTLLASGQIELTLPSKPSSRLQAYRLTSSPPAP